MISPPSLISLNLQESNLLKANLKFSSEFGFEISEFGGKGIQYSCSSCKYLRCFCTGAFIQILDSLEQEHVSKRRYPCRAHCNSRPVRLRVKGNNRLSVKEADALIDELINLENPYNCPHGRPTNISMTNMSWRKSLNELCR